MTYPEEYLFIYFMPSCYIYLDLETFTICVILHDINLDFGMFSLLYSIVHLKYIHKHSLIHTLHKYIIYKNTLFSSTINNTSISPFPFSIVTQIYFYPIHQSDLPPSPLTFLPFPHPSPYESNDLLLISHFYSHSSSSIC